jgi:hypothetical protein
MYKKHFGKMKEKWKTKTSGDCDDDKDDVDDDDVDEDSNDADDNDYDGVL